MKKITLVRKNPAGFDESVARPDPLDQFLEWYQEAVKNEVVEPDAMLLSTAGRSGQPSGRIVLLKQADSRGFVFFTNYLSLKATDIA